MGVFGRFNCGISIDCSVVFKWNYPHFVFNFCFPFFIYTWPPLQLSQLLKDPKRRKHYDEDGVIPFDNDDDDETSEQSKTSWKDYFDLIFGKLSTDDIDSFAAKYKMSDEEEKDVLENYTKFKG